MATLVVLAALLIEDAGAAFAGARAKVRSQLALQSQTAAGNCATHQSGFISTYYQVEWQNALAVTAWAKIVKEEKHTWTSRELSQDQAKLGLVFMVDEHFPLQEAWRIWLQDADASKYRLVIHSSTGNYSLHAPKEFRDAIMDKVVPSTWCSMVPAVFAATRVALADPTVQKIVLIDGSSLPLKPFDFVFSSLLPQLSASGAGSRGFLPLSEMCTDEEWHRGMPWSYVLTRADALLLSKSEDALAAMFAGMSSCDIEDWFVIAFELAKHPYSTSCVTWNGWTTYKGFSSRTNGKHYDKIVGSDPSLRWSKMFIGNSHQSWEDAIFNGSSGTTYLPSSCTHPLVLVDVPVKIMDDMMLDPNFLFARKFNASGKIGDLPLLTYLQKFFTQVKRTPAAVQIKVVPHDYGYLWHLWLQKLKEDRERWSPLQWFLFQIVAVASLASIILWYCMRAKQARQAKDVAQP